MAVASCGSQRTGYGHWQCSVMLRLGRIRGSQLASNNTLAGGAAAAAGPGAELLPLRPVPHGCADARLVAANAATEAPAGRTAPTGCFQTVCQRRLIRHVARSCFKFILTDYDAVTLIT